MAIFRYSGSGYVLGLGLYFVLSVRLVMLDVNISVWAYLVLLREMQQGRQEEWEESSFATVAWLDGRNQDSSATVVLRTWETPMD
jgi:hypothetical protein